jgi:hypothetical protein
VDGTTYRSYVIRAWGHGPGGGTVVRVLVEEVQSGRQTELRGARAGALATHLEDALSAPVTPCADGTSDMVDDAATVARHGGP